MKLCTERRGVYVKTDHFGGQRVMISFDIPFAEILFDFHDRSRGPLPIDAWVSQLEQLSESLFAETDEGSSQVRTLHSAFEELRSLAGGSGYAGAITLKALRREIGALLVEQTPAVGFLRRSGREQP